MDDFIPNPKEIYNYFYDEQTEKTNTFLRVAQQHDPDLRHFLFRKNTKTARFSSVNGSSKQGTATLL